MVRDFRVAAGLTTMRDLERLAAARGVGMSYHLISKIERGGVLTDDSIEKLRGLLELSDEQIAQLRAAYDEHRLRLLNPTPEERIANMERMIARLRKRMKKIERKCEREAGRVDGLYQLYRNGGDGGDDPLPGPPGSEMFRIGRKVR